MGQAKARGDYYDRKNNPKGKSSNHTKGFHDLRPINQLRFLEAKREREELLARKRLGK